MIGRSNPHELALQDIADGSSLLRLVIVLVLALTTSTPPFGKL
jgi:hypothetical protein